MKNKLIFISLFFLSILCLIYIFDLLDLQTIRSYVQHVHVSVHEHYRIAALLFLLLYMALVAVAVPTGGILTMAGGYLFGVWPAVMLVTLAATSGAVISFWGARYYASDAVRALSPKLYDCINDELREHGYSYLLFLRLFPLAPFFVLNPLIGLTGVSLPMYIITTAVGILPGNVVYAYAGPELFAVTNIRDIFSLRMMLLCGGLGAVSFLPVAINKWRKRNVHA